MDGRARFLALADPDLFDVPWRVADVEGTEGPLVAPSGCPEGWRHRTAGLWQSMRPPGDPLPPAGWKIHVGARPAEAAAVAAAVAAVCFAEGAAWKVLRSTGLVRVATDKHAPPSLTGKTCVVYPVDDAHAARLVGLLGHALAGVLGPRVLGDRPHGAAPLGVRWGAYAEDWVEADDGRLVLAVVAAGALVPDHRGQTTRPLPEALARALAPEAPATLPLREVELVQRSTTGALYRAVLDDGRCVALKEARHHTGIDADGVDAVARLRHEHAVLGRLAGSGIAPDPVDYWPGPHSDLLVSTWVEGPTLVRRASQANPRSRADLDGEADYDGWAERTCRELAALVARMHLLGVTHGDLTPANVVCGAEAGPRLLDFETACLDGVGVTAAVATPGFHLDDPDPVARDLFGLARTAAYVLDPDVLLLDRRPDLAPHFPGAPPVRAALGAAPDPAPTGPDDLVRRLDDGVLARATPHRADRLFPGGCDQFTDPLGGHDLLSGAAGVLLARQARGHDADPVHLDWLAAVPPGAQRQHGLGVGAEGVALALALLGRGEQAATVVDGCRSPLPRSISWARGRAGCAVALLELGALLGRHDLTERGRAAAADVAAAVADPEVRLAEAGLLDGWSGVAVALARASYVDADPGLHAAAVAALHRARAPMRPTGDRLVVTSAGRVHTGLGRGSAGFVLAVALAAPDDARLRADAAAAARACAAVAPPLAGLLDGLAGTITALRALGGHDDDVARLAQRATWHGVATARGWSTLGEQRLRCADDLGTGSAGLLAVLGTPGLTGVTHVLRLPGTRR
ncbi:hypothetical protein [Nocardioides litoris]|uniref:class III lanthionine synthetase LanKC N-terminal domain-containing protein n=1 Tax=Nocardioides litoris TaxID=1926648 RepID=UPI00112179B6|nr:hypothetical protein [Nocardioides litoris]